METLTPQIETPSEPQKESVPGGAPNENWKNIEFLDYLGLKDELSNDEVMKKITLISEVIPDVSTLMDTDLKLGHPNMSKIDKIYSYAFLLKQESDIKRKHDLIINQKKQWEKPQAFQT
jgi:hypothetical protein